MLNRNNRQLAMQWKTVLRPTNENVFDEKHRSITSCQLSRTISREYLSMYRINWWPLFSSWKMQITSISVERVVSIWNILKHAFIRRWSFYYYRSVCFRPRMSGEGNHSDGKYQTWRHVLMKKIAGEKKMIDLWREFQHNLHDLCFLSDGWTYLDQMFAVNWFVLLYVKKEMILLWNGNEFLGQVSREEVFVHPHSIEQEFARRKVSSNLSQLPESSTWSNVFSKQRLESMVTTYLFSFEGRSWHFFLPVN